MGSSLKYTESPSRGTWGSPWSPFIALPSFLKGATYHDNMEQADSVPRAVVGTKVPAASCGFTGTHSRGGRHGQAYPRIVAAYLHGRVCRRRHVRRNPAPLKAAVAIGARADAPRPYVAVDTHCLFLLSRGRVLGRLGWQASQTTRASFLD